MGSQDRPSSLQVSWIQADFFQIPVNDSETQLFIPFSLHKQSLPFERVSGEREFETEFDLSISIYAFEKGKKVSDRELKPEARLSEEMKSFRFTISEEERNSKYPSYYLNSFSLALPSMQADKEWVAVFEIITQNGKSISTRLPIQKEALTNWIVPISESSTTEDVSLLSLGNQVVYGQDFNLIVGISPQTFSKWIIDQGSSSSETPKFKAELFSGDDKVPLFSKEITFSPFTAIENLPSSDSNLRLRLNSVDQMTSNNWVNTMLEVPGKQLPNEEFTVRISSITPSNSEKPDVLAERKFRSYWPNMPASLLRIDLAIDRLSYILTEDQVKEMKSGNRTSQIRAFFDYWTPLDPTPESHFNELMVEYYTRIDVANERYTTPSAKGAESDQGRNYILYGDPDRIERQFPTQGPSIEIWYYPSFTLTFEATSGFGDYKLIDRTL